jgi:UDP-N-acetylglucosamine diphosphorylase / glucose-1-phosphate thymidylyltransferase / UDP-N-acetylgalactosamine diphosphorylase / glucosamine-1-phosphate N-acetyltransferase / galactosamine-1-phosphate N-acetyltransferase
MKAVVLAAGEGLRLGPFTETQPKVMLPVGNKPILHHVIDALQKTTIDEIIVVIGYQKNKILQYFKDYPKLPIKYIEQEKQLGTAHALYQAKDEIDDDFLVIFGDNLIDVQSLQKMIDLKTANGILITSHAHPSNYGVVDVSNSILTNITEKPDKDENRFIATGIYRFEKTIFDHIKQSIDQGQLGMSAIIQSLLDHKVTIGTERTNNWRDIVYPWDLLLVNESFSSTITRKIGGTIEKQVHIKGPIIIGENTRISSGTYLVGPLIIGNDCEIGPNSCIFPSTVIGNNCVIQPFTSIRNSVIMDDSRIGAQSYIARSIIAERVQLGHHVTLSEQDAIVSIGDEMKMVNDVGVMIGEDTIIDSQVTIDPGIIIGKDCLVESLNHVTKNVKSKVHVM